MSHFPVTSSHLSVPDLAVFIQQKYQLPAGVTCRLLKAGINHSYLVSAGNTKYVFRVYSFNWRTKKEIQEEIKLLRILANNKIAVSYAITDGEGDYIQEIHAPEGMRYAVLFSFAKGEKRITYPEELHFTIGEMMAKMHAVTENLFLERVTYTKDVLLVDSFAQLPAFISPETEEMQFMRSVQEHLLKILPDYNSASLRRGVVHLDIWFDNLNIYNDKEVTIFDFDFCGNGLLAYDIAYYILQIHGVEKDEMQCRLKADSFLKGYESVTAITAEERKLLPMMGVALYFFYLGVQCKRFDNWSNVFINETYFKRFIAVLVKKYYDQYKMPAEELA